MSQEEPIEKAEPAEQTVAITLWGEQAFEPHANFDWDAIEPDRRQEFKDEVLHASKRFAVALLTWIYGNEQRPNPEGIKLRASVAAWYVLPQLQHHSQTSLCEAIGVKHKQSIGRAAISFRDAFGLIAAQMRSDRARAHLKQTYAERRNKPSADNLDPGYQETHGDGLESYADSQANSAG